jgi:hypothetical protein
MKQTIQAVRSLKQSIFLDVYGLASSFTLKNKTRVEMFFRVKHSSLSGRKNVLLQKVLLQWAIISEFEDGIHNNSDELFTISVCVVVPYCNSDYTFFKQYFVATAPLP